MSDNITLPNRDLFDVANADDGEKLELARIGLIDLSVFELLDIARRAREAIPDNPSPRLQAKLAKVDKVRATNVVLARAMLDKQRKAN
jgi:hypothetical protein